MNRDEHLASSRYRIWVWCQAMPSKVAIRGFTPECNYKVSLRASSTDSMNKGSRRILHSAFKRTQASGASEACGPSSASRYWLGENHPGARRTRYRIRHFHWRICSEWPGVVTAAIGVVPKLHALAHQRKRRGNADATRSHAKSKYPMKNIVKTNGFQQRKPRLQTGTETTLQPRTRVIITRRRSPARIPGDRPAVV